MNIYRSLDEIPFDPETVLTIGTFDGLHRGHCALLDTLVERAKTRNSRALLITFHPHPQIILQKAGRPPVRLLTTISERLELLEDHALDNVLVLPFTREFAAIEAEHFVQHYLSGKIGMRHILVGHDHMFGKGRQGNLAMLGSMSRELGFSVEEVPARDVGGTTVSSTRIRHALQNGDIDSANSMLGYHYRLSGTVVRGDGRGRQIGVPTANIRPENEHKLLPANGVYCVAAELDGLPVYGMANIGVRPTFTNDTEARLEVHFFDVDKMLYNRSLKISFLKFIRKERKFVSLDQFLAQLGADRLDCRRIIEEHEKNNRKQ